MAIYEYKGVVELIGETKAFGQNGFTKRDLVVGNDVDSPNKYPNPVLFTFKKERCALCDTVQKGDRVMIHFSIDGRRWDGPNGTRYFTDLTGLKLEKINGDGTTTEPMPEPPPPPPAAADVGMTDTDNLPF